MALSPFDKETLAHEPINYSTTKKKRLGTFKKSIWLSESLSLFPAAIRIASWRKTFSSTLRFPRRRFSLMCLCVKGGKFRAGRRQKKSKSKPFFIFDCERSHLDPNCLSTFKTVLAERVFFFLSFLSAFVYIYKALRKKVIDPKEQKTVVTFPRRRKGGGGSSRLSGKTGLAHSTQRAK